MVYFGAFNASVFFSQSCAVVFFARLIGSGGGGGGEDMREERWAFGGQVCKGNFRKVMKNSRLFWGESLSDDVKGFPSLNEFSSLISPWLTTYGSSK